MQFLLPRLLMNSSLLFYDTYFYAKDNCNWGNEKKDNYFREKWSKKYFDIIYTNKNDEKNKNGNDEIFFFEKNKTNDINIYSSNKRLRYQNITNSKILPNNLSESIKNKNIYETKNDIDEFQIETNQNNKKKYRYSLPESNNGINTQRDSRKFILDKNLKFQIKNMDLNNINNKLFYSSKKINGFVPNEEIYPKSMNNYYQLEEREIKPLKTKDILNCKNPFGIREVTYKKSNTLKEIFSKDENPVALSGYQFLIGGMILFAIGSLMGGTVVIEQIFSIPGLGQYTLTGINQRDYPVVQGCVLFIAVLYVVINLLVDILYTYIDPRISYN